MDSQRRELQAALRANRPASLEAWVRLHSYRGCPVLAAGGGYRLGLYCATTGSPTGLLVFAGPFAGRAYLSEEPLPLGAWVHLAGRHDGRSALLEVDGREVTAGRIAAFAARVPLGYDPWERIAAICTRRPRPGCPPRGRLGGVPDGEVAGSRLVLSVRSLADIAAARGVPGRFAPLPPPAAAGRGARPKLGYDGRAVPDSAPRGVREITRAGWAILGAVLLLSTALAAVAALLWNRGATRSARGPQPIELLPPPPYGDSAAGLLPSACGNSAGIFLQP